jgi:hypothetical protein
LIPPVQTSFQKFSGSRLTHINSITRAVSSPAGASEIVWLFEN